MGERGEAYEEVKETDQEDSGLKQDADDAPARLTRRVPEVARLPLRQTRDAGDAVAEGGLLGGGDGAVVVGLPDDGDDQDESQGGHGEVYPEGRRPRLGGRLECGEEGPHVGA